MDEKQTEIRFAATAILPVVAAHSCLAPFWLATSDGALLPTAAILLTGLVAPGYLAMLGCRLIMRRISVAVPLGLGVIVIALSLNFFLDYSLWGIASGLFWSPDEGTVEVLRLIALAASTVFTLPLITTLVIRYGLQRHKRYADPSTSRGTNL